MKHRPSATPDGQGDVSPPDELHRSMQSFIIQASPDPVVIVRNGICRFASPSFTSAFGYGIEPGKKELPFDRLLLPQDRQRFAKLCENCLTGRHRRRTLRISLLTSDNEPIFCEISATPLTYDDHKAILFFIRDISDRWHAEQQLRQSELQYRTTLDSMGESIQVVDEDLRIMLINKSFRNWLTALGVKNEVVGLSIFEAFPFIDPKVGDEYRRVFMTGRILVTEEKTAIHGLEIITESRKIPVLEDGRVARVVTVIKDITDNRRAEEELRSSRDRLQAVLDSLEAIVYVSDMDTYEVLLANKYTRDLFGNIEGGKCWQTLQQGQNGPCAFCTNRKLVNGNGKPAGTHVWEFQNTVTRRWYECRDRAIHWLDGRLVRLQIATDITDRRRLEREATKNRNLESLGMLAGGIAHDFNNLLTAVFGNIELARMNLQPDNESYHLLNEAEQASEKARHLTRQLLTFSRGGQPIKQTASINDMLRDAGAFMLSGTNIQCDMEFDDDKDPVDIDKEQMSQVFHNILLNAREAMTDGGRLMIRTENLSVNPAGDLPLEEGNYLKISFRDTGPGIHDEHLPRIFDPYFSTKSLSSRKGTGLGLAICHSVIKQHGGYITARSAPAGGACFEIYLPTSARQHKAPLPETAVRPAVSAGLRLLLMDDEEAVARTAAGMLKHLGYEIVISNTGEEAVELYRRAMQKKRPFHAVILDLTVKGGMGGREAIGHLLRVDPEVKAVVASGFINDPVLTDCRDYGFREAILKPYRIHTLREVLERLNRNDASEPPSIPPV